MFDAIINQTSCQVSWSKALAVKMQFPLQFEKLIVKNIQYENGPRDEARSLSVYAPIRKPEGKVPFLYFTHGIKNILM